MIVEKVKTELAHALIQAQMEQSPVAPLTEAYPELTLADAYAIQHQLVKIKLEEGSRVKGKKVGFTTRPIQESLGLDEPGYGYLFDTLEIGDGKDLPIDRLIKPKVEAEVAFVLKNRLRGPGLTVADVLSATDYVAPALEIIDCRIRDWKVKLPDIIADNIAQGTFVVGNTHTIADGIDLSRVEMRLEKNDEVALTGVGSSVLGNPVHSVVWLANKLAQVGIELKPGEVILSGSLATPLAVSKGDAIKASFSDLGSVAVRFV